MYLKNLVKLSSNLIIKTNIYSESPEKAMIQIGIKPNFELDTLSLDADLSWKSLPWLFDLNSITGEVSTNLKSPDKVITGILRICGVLLEEGDRPPSGGWPSLGGDPCILSQSFEEFD